MERTRSAAAGNGPLADRLAEFAPPQRNTGIVHGDYRIGNVMVDGAGTVVAVLDWELWTLGDVLADVGFLALAVTLAGNRVWSCSPVASRPSAPARSRRRDPRHGGRAARQARLTNVITRSGVKREISRNDHPRGPEPLLAPPQRLFGGAPVVDVDADTEPS